MNGMEFHLVEAFLQFLSPAVVVVANYTLWPVDAANNPAHWEMRSHQHHISIDGMTWRSGQCDSASCHRLAGKNLLVATLVSAGVAAILTSTSLRGFSVQACVT
jgi:hypothetical protein